MKKKTVYLLGWITLIGFGGGGLSLIYFVNGVCPLDLLKTGRELYIQILLGVLYGLVSAVLVILMMKHRSMAGEQEYYNKLFQKLGIQDFSFFEIVFLAFCAGVGEELFFRGFVQPHLGIIITSILFVAMHGYLNPNKRIFFFGLFITVFIAGIGWMFDHVGPWSAIVTHFIYDLILLVKIKFDLSEDDDSLIRTDAEFDE